MARFNVIVPVTATISVEVEAESPDEAAAKAKKSVDDIVGDAMEIANFNGNSFSLEERTDNDVEVEDLFGRVFMR